LIAFVIPGDLRKDINDSKFETIEKIALRVRETN